MGKRSDFNRRDNDLYTTFDPKAGRALQPHLDPTTLYYEPCAGDGALIGQLAALGHICVHAADIVPMAPNVAVGNALDLQTILAGALIITNPPWSRPILHALIVHLSDLAPTWLLFDADWIHTRQAIPYLDRCRKIVSVGRLRWIEGTTMSGKDNCAWYLFDTARADNSIRFYGQRPH